METPKTTTTSIVVERGTNYALYAVLFKYLTFLITKTKSTEKEKNENREVLKLLTVTYFGRSQEDGNCTIRKRKCLFTRPKRKASN